MYNIVLCKFCNVVFVSVEGTQDGKESMRKFFLTVLCDIIETEYYNATSKCSVKKKSLKCYHVCTRVAS